LNCLVVEDQTILLDLLASVVGSFAEILNVYKADCIRQALEHSKSQALDIAILDLALPDGEGSALGEHLLQHHPAIKLIILSGSAQQFICPTSLEAAIYGVIDKTDAFEALRHCLNSIIQPVHQQLTGRQQQVYALLGEGKSTKEIAVILGSSPATVETHRKAIAQRLHLSGAELIHAATLNQHVDSID